MVDVIQIEDGNTEIVLFGKHSQDVVKIQGVGHQGPMGDITPELEAARDQAVTSAGAALVSEHNAKNSEAASAASAIAAAANATTTSRHLTQVTDLRDQTAVLKGQVDQAAADTATNATNAAASEQNAKASENNSKASETAAKISETNSAAAQTASETARDESVQARDASQRAQAGSEAARDQIQDLIDQVPDFDARIEDVETSFTRQITDLDTRVSSDIAELQTSITEDIGVAVDSLQEDLSVIQADKADLNSPAFVGTPTAPTAPAGTNTGQIATTGFVSREIQAIVDMAPEELNTLKEIADRIISGEDQQDSIIQSLATKASISYVDNELAKKANLSYVNAQLADKTDRTYTDNELAKKADKTYTDTELAKKVTAPTGQTADRILFWDNSVGRFANLALGSGLSITDTTLSVTFSQSPAASTTEQGIIRISTVQEAAEGQSEALAVSPAGMKAYVEEKVEALPISGSLVTSHSFTTDSRGTDPYTLPVSATSKHAVWVLVDTAPVNSDDYEVNGTDFWFTRDPGVGLLVDLRIVAGLAVSEPVDDSITSAKINAADAVAIRDKIRAAYADDGVQVGMPMFSPTGKLYNGYFYAEGGTFDVNIYTQLAVLYPDGVLPDMRDRVLRGAGPLAGEAGTTQEDAMQRLTGSFADIGGQPNRSFGLGMRGPTGVFAAPDTQGRDAGPVSGSQAANSTTNGMSFDNARQARTASENRVKSYVGRWLIKAYSAPVDLDSYDLMALEQAVNRKFERSNIIGPVSQAAGVPTGAIIERGSNANGEYTKFADGTMICTRLVPTGTYTVSALQYIHVGAFACAASFVSLQYSGASYAGSWSPGLIATLDGITNTTWPSVLLANVRPADVVCGGNIFLLSIGRWF